VRGVRRINNSQFVDDTLLLGGASQIMAQRFKLVLDQYEQASGGLINKNKSQIYAWNVKVGTMARIAISSNSPSLWIGNTSST
jgi:hypothetical protein